MHILAANRPSVRAGSPPGNWREAMKSAIRDARTLCEELRLPTGVAESAGRAAEGFPIFVPQPFLARMQPGDIRDPLLRQVLPLDEELRPQPGFSADPVGDGEATHGPGLLRKYTGRALLITTGACAIHCRYCFRRHFPYEEAPKSLAAWHDALEAIAADGSIHEVLLSGGDPLTLVDETLEALVERLAAIPHLRRLRVHSRLPVVIPRRVDDRMLAWFTGTRLTPVMVIHANHPNELDAEVAESVGRLIAAGVPVLNQAVLLRGVNDRVETLAELSERLLDIRVTPYYLHQLDRVAGAAHFEVPVAEGQRLIEQLRSRLPGYAVPRYVQEIAGDSHKRVLA
ncbi:MAG: EF-P beta-lysylation protein EpmB [Planctomycetales bacterium]|nr:EF-P beta-lysylation protein EpmB [Planctomycetales bacterium]